MARSDSSFRARSAPSVPHPSVPPNPAAHLRADGLSHSYGDRRVLTDLSLVLDPAERIGLIGENGAGKSTLLRILAGDLTPDAGVVTRPSTVGYLRQELPFGGEQSLDDVLEAALARERTAERELEAAGIALGFPGPHPSSGIDPAERYAAALERAERLDVWSAESRRDTVLAGLGLGGLPLERRIAQISGGQRSRLALAALLLARPALLLLDEPTNHLDDQATDHLRQTLVDWPGVVLFASHDRAFLDEVATAVIDIDPAEQGGARRFGGTFSHYLAAKAAERERWQRRYDDEQVRVGELQESVEVTSRRVAPDRGRRDNEKMMYGLRGERVQGQISRRVRDARGRLEALRENPTPMPPAPLRFGGVPGGAHPLGSTGDEGAGGPGAASATSKRRAPMMVLDGVWVEGRLGSPDWPVSVRLEPLSRLLVTGANGAGKSTLLSLLARAGAGAGAGAAAGADGAADALAPSGGSITRARGLRVGLLAQDVRFPHPSLSPREIYERSLGGARAERVPLSQLGLLADHDLDRATGSLSVGQQRRLALALVLARPPHLLLLDEPTNHLSLQLASELEEAFGGYPGAVVVATHDRWLRRRWSGEVLALGDGGGMLRA
ncbi:ABC-F family ATP-binding cassette domain-containing protein [Herbiconiux sp. YIM B11900]|uniref:ABC-F family ATP-binding cassette domain-containing protein n=1 Tax=Herbiconiux sp. YIM B11900 TaxID=3404131 RepID=UPI003F839CF1